MDIKSYATNYDQIRINRSKFSLPHEEKGTMISGRLYPTFYMEVLAGDTIKINMSQIIRSVTPVVPVMDNSYISHYFFYVPYRFLFEDKLWQRMFGENTSGAWANNTNVALPTFRESIIRANPGGDSVVNSVVAGDILNRVGFPIGEISNGHFGSVEFGLNDIPLRAYNLIWNEFFRDQNTQAPLTYDEYVHYSFTDGASDLPYLIHDVVLAGDVIEKGVYKVNKRHDLFTSALPSLGKSASSVLIPLSGDQAIVKYDGSYVTTTTAPHFVTASGQMVTGTLSNTTSSGNDRITASNGSSYPLGYDPKGSLYADLSTGIQATISDFVKAYNLQKIFMRQGITGTRYREIINGEFGTRIHNLEDNVPELLGGKNIPLNMNQVLQTSSTDATSPLGETGAYSVTGDNDHYLTKSFNDYGIIMCVSCIRTDLSYTQGVNKLLTKSNAFDFYRPGLAFLGEVKIENRLQYMQYDSAKQSENLGAFGYQEYGFEYRDLPNHTVGLLDPVAGDKTMTAWTYTTKFNGLPVLNDSYMIQSEANIDQTLTVEAATAGYQFVYDLFFDIEAVRPIPVHSELNLGSWF